MSSFLKKSRSDGFTLLEVLIALAILAISLLSLYTAEGNALRASGRALLMEQAGFLAQQIMTQKLSTVEHEMDKGAFPEEDVEERGQFEEPFAQFRWEYRVRRVEIPLDDISSQLDQAQAAKPDSAATTSDAPASVITDNQVPTEILRSLTQIISKQINDSVRELEVKVLWGQEESEQSLVLTTHVAKL